MFPQMLPCLPTLETLLRKQNILPEKQKCFLQNSETFDVSLCSSLMFPSVCPLWETWRNIGMQETIFPSLPKGLSLYIGTIHIYDIGTIYRLLSRSGSGRWVFFVMNIGYLKHFFKIVVFLYSHIKILPSLLCTYVCPVVTPSDLVCHVF